MLIRNESKLYTGEISIKFFSLFGLWKPTSWNSKCKIWCYRLYSVVMISIYICFTFTLLMYLMTVSKNTESFTLNLYNFFAIFAVFVKQISIMMKRKIIIDLKEKFLDELCQPRDVHEVRILQKHSQICRSNVKIFLMLFTITGLVAVLSPFTKGKNMTLPLTAWHPYTLESRVMFCLTYLFQAIAIIMAACTSACVEGLALTIILQICAQLDIMSHRLYLLPRLQQQEDCRRETRIISDCIKHYIHIYSLGKQLNNLFVLVIFVQFFTSMISLGAIIYQLSRLNPNNPTYWMMVASIGSVTTQSFLYCFYGEKIIQKSTAVADAVHQMNWILLTNRSKKDLLIIMTRAISPIKLTVSAVAVMSIKTFVKIIKSAYSAYNLLKNA